MNQMFSVNIKGKLNQANTACKERNITIEKVHAELENSTTLIVFTEEDKLIDWFNFGYEYLKEPVSGFPDGTLLLFSLQTGEKNG